MARQVDRLSARAVATLKTPGRHSDGGGLYLAIDASGRRRWIFRYKWHGKVRDMGLGPAPTISLYEAREAATEARKLIVKGADPLAEKAKAKAAMMPATFGDVADKLTASMAPSWRNAKHASQWTHSLTVHAAKLRTKHVADIETSDVLEVLKPLWSTAPETASRLRGRIERILDAAKAEGLRTGENVARWRGHLRELLPAPKKLQAGRRGHVKALPFDQMPDFVADLRKRKGTAALAMELLILTATRTGEVIAADWKEFDIPKAEWIIPAAHTKTGKLHRVPLSARALEILAELAEAGNKGWVFPSFDRRKHLSNMAMTLVLRRMNRDDVMTIHGCRSSFRDWAAETTNFSNEVCEAALGHVIKNEVEAAYRRGDLFVKRRALMDAWASYLRAPPADNVVAFGRTER
jgi:integrase